MVRRIAWLLLLCGMLGMGIAAAEDVPARCVDLGIPRAAAANETAMLQVQVGYLPRGTEIDVRTSEGRLIGTVSPFAIHDHQAAGTYSFPLQAGDVANGHVTLLLTLRRAGMAPRAPTEGEVPRVTATFIRTAR